MSSRREKGFTLFELMVVVAIMLVIATIGLPSMSGFFKTSKVRQGAETLRGAMSRCQLAALTSRKKVALYFDYPEDGMIEMWSFKSKGYTDPEIGSMSSGGCESIGYWTIHLLDNRATRMPDGVRAVACWYDEGTGDVYWPHMCDSEIGRIKAHWVAFGQDGSKVHWASQAMVYPYYMVIEEGSGEHLFLKIASGITTAARPRIKEDWTIKSVDGTVISDPAEIWPLVAAKVYPFGHGEIFTGQ